MFIILNSNEELHDFPWFGTENLENLRKCPFLRKVSENLEKSGKTFEKAYKSGKGME